MLRASKCSRTPARGLRVGVAAHLHRQPVRAAPHGRREIGAQDQLRRRRVVPACRRPASALQRIQAGAGGQQRIGERQRGAGGHVAAAISATSAWPSQTTLAGRVGDLVRPRSARPRSPSWLSRRKATVLRSVSRISFSDTAERLTVRQRHRRRLAARQHEQAGVERDARAGGSASRPASAVSLAATGRPRPASPARSITRVVCARRQAGDAELVALPRHRGARHRRIEPHPVLRVEVVAAGRAARRTRCRRAADRPRPPARTRRTTARRRAAASASIRL